MSGYINDPRKNIHSLYYKEMIINPFLSVKPEIPLDGLVLYLDAGNKLSYTDSLHTWNDLSGLNNNAAFRSGDLPDASSEAGGCLDWAASDCAAMGAFGTAVGNQFTYNIFCKPNALGGEKFLFNFKYASNQTQFELNGNSYGLYGAGSGSSLLSNDNWYMLTCSFDGATLKYYKNGILDGSTTYSGFTSASEFYIGTYPGSYGAYGFIGKIAIINGYNRAITQAEVTKIFDKFKSRFE